MFQSFLSAFSASPGWFSIMVLLFLFEFSLIVAAMIRQGRKRLFASTASVVVAMLYALAMMMTGVWNAWLAHWKPAFSTAFMGSAGTLSFYHAQFLYAMGFFILLGLALTIGLAVVGLLALRFSFAKRILVSLVDVPRQALVFAFIWLLLLAVFPFVLPLSNDVLLLDLLQASSFLLLLQSFLRFIRGSRFERPADLVAFSFQTGLLMIFMRGLSATIWQDFPFFVAPIAVNFFHELFAFFLGLLLSGMIGAFLVRNHFSHLYFSPHGKRQSFFSPGFFGALLLVPNDHALSELRLILGIILAFFFTAMLVLASFFSSLLILLPLFFIAYFFLFAILDHYVISIDVLSSRPS